QNHDEYKNDCLKQGLVNVVDGLLNEHGSVVNDAVLDPGRKLLGHFIHLFADGGGRLQCVGSGELKHRQRGARVTVEVAAYVVVLGAQFHALHVASDIAQIRDRTILTRLDHDLLELVGIGQTTQGVDCQLKIHARGRGRLTESAGGNLEVLFLDG